ncbi:MAG: hypothetical protein B7Y51_03190 [Burkholderiales bacterium 28-67-8]|nr:MAG: hypothetical protein B7Y51_03190 [Burkholderiales bacterium 28-67-8]
MQGLWHRRRFSAWLAAWVMLIASLAPTLSQAFHGNAGGLWIEVCSSLGAGTPVVVDLPDPHPSPQSSLLHTMEHCPYCSLQAAASAPPPTPAGVFLLPLTFEVPLLFLAAPRTLHAWRHALSRGPPSIA